jgi:PKD repeat protein
VAVLQQIAAAELGRMLTPGEIENLLVNTAHQFGDRTWQTDTRNPGSTTGTSFDAGHGLVDLAAAVESLATTTVDTDDEGPTCAVDARFTDPAGDATGALGVEVPGGPNATSLDVVESWLSTDPVSKDVTFHWQVSDLTDQPGGTDGTGEYFDYNFTLGGAGYYLGAYRTLEDGESFVIGDFGGTNSTRRTLGTATGSFDPATDEITATLSNQTWVGLGKPALADGQSIGGLEIVGRRSLVLLVPDADTAAGSCAYLIGAENVPPNTAPSAQAVATPSTAPAGTEIALDASTSTDAETPFGLTYAWDFGDGGSALDSTSATPRVTYSAAGEYTATVVVTDPEGLSDTASVLITVTERPNTAPTAQATVDHTPGKRGEDFVFSGLLSSDAETPNQLTYRWNFGDGTTATGASVRKVYTKTGRYTVLLTVTDPSGASATDTIAIKVTG